MNDLAEKLVAMWSDPEARPPFKGRLISDDGCYCAQGQVLRCVGRSDDYLRELKQVAADLEVAKLLGISRAHSVLLRNVNDRQDGCPQGVLTAPEKILGSEANRILAFWRRLDTMTAEQWVVVWEVTWTAFGAVARDAVWEASHTVAGEAAQITAERAVQDAAFADAKDADERVVGDAARVATRTAVWATLEIQGHSLLPSLYFLPFFGINSIEELDQ